MTAHELKTIFKLCNLATSDDGFWDRFILIANIYSTKTKIRMIKLALFAVSSKDMLG